MSQRTIFVSGATGTVGGAVARNLLSEGIAVRALARDPDSPAAKALSALGASIIQGDYDDDTALTKAMSGVAGAFLNLTPNFVDHTWELTTAKRIMAAARQAGATHFIYSSSFAVQAPELLKHWDPNSFIAKVLLSKQAIEKEVRKAGFSNWTILRPGHFAANYLVPLAAKFPELVNDGRFVTALRPENKVPMVDPNDIGRFALAAFQDPGKFNAEEVAISSELLTVDDIMAKLARATGRDIKAVYLSDEEVEAQKAGNPFIGGQLAARDIDQFADVEKTQSWGVPLGTFDEFLEREKDRVKETYGQLA
ncbi:NmrA-like family domain-containing protein 1 [Colletotrichum spaethianum]|uniref:NmrA-like family domain-containing protein 1 n=1 Tax=Colletotrichum spaethianum TaxID=700344 RepID=A0AA37PFV3_9PEZI|nr:NmrA-like family domain-containing protein 1 [Colletotrichum spaethianum]GKT51457.1 NmrA-like family domain-containing protein 1 [Colletotrichum spaethianum]